MRAGYSSRTGPASRTLGPRPGGTTTRRRRLAVCEDHSWAKLMRYSFGLDVLGCPRCKKRLKLVAVIHDRAEVKRRLQNLHLWSDPIPIRPARAPPGGPPDGFDFPRRPRRDATPRRRGAR